MKFSIRPRKHKYYLQMDNKIKLDTIEEAIDDFRQGKFIIVVDDEDRETKATSSSRQRKSHLKM